MKKEKENYLDRIPCHTSGYRWTRDEGGLVTIHVVHRGFFARLAQDFLTGLLLAILTLMRLAVPFG
ncbi:hypothetical protein M5E89_13560 [Acidaminococcus intestini]|nr:hypothetical protein M5E89_13560 [Acidaminococcus intestini]